MEENKLKGLRKLQGLQGISKEEQEIWRTINREKLKGKDSRYEDRLYRNQQFVKTFGKEALLSYNKNQRDAIYKDYVANEIFKETYSPYTGKVDKLGNPIVDPNKGMGNAEEYEKYNSMTADGKIKLLESGWKSENQLNNLLKKRQESHRKALSNTNAFIGAPAYAQGAALYSKEVTDPIDEVYSKGKNNAIIDKIYSDDLKKQTKLLDKEVAVEYDTNIRNLSDDEVNKEFMQRITPSENSLGNNNFKAFFHDGNNIESEVKDYSIDDKRLYLAKANVYNKYFGAYTAKDALEYEAQEYISDHQDIIDYSGALANDIGIATMSYTASKVNGIRQGINRFRGNSLVWIDSDGNIIAPNKIKTASNGAHYYTNNEGYNTIVKQREMSIANLDLLGKDADGYDLPNIFNNQYWSDAEQFGTLNKEEQQEYKKLGVSPHKVMYKPGEGTDYKYETAKMLSFGMADALINLLPYGLGWAGKTLQGANTFLNATGKVMQWSGKMSGAIQPTASAIGLGHQYGIGTFNEGFAQNMANLEEKVYNNIETEFKEKYQNDAKFKASIDKQVQAEYNKLKKEQQRQLSAGENNMQIADQKVNDELLKRQAMNNVGTAYKQEELKKARNSDKYFNSVSKAIEDAGVSATAMAVTDAAKYSIVNNFGYRKYLFGTAESRKVSALKKMSDKVSEKDGILKFNGLLNLKENAKKLKTALSDAEKRAVLAEKAKTIGKIVKDQAIGGAWTNYTDEMQSWGSKQINEDMFTSYLNNTYDVESAVDLYNALDGVESFLKGATGSIGRKSNTDAGIVGITGSLFTLAPNVAGILHAFTKEGKKQWSKATNGERINMIVQQGILNNYYAKKQAEAEIQRSVDMVNTLNQQNDNFTSLRQVLTLNRAIENATNQEQKNILTYLQALTSIQNLHKFSTDVGVQEQSSSRIKEWFRKKFGGDESALDAVAAQSTILTKALAELSEITSGNFNDATKKELLAEYYAKNPDKAQTEENNNKALEEITNNAKSLIEAESKWQEIDAKLKQVEEDRGEPINSKAREKLLTNSALDSYYGERINTLEEKISGKAANTSREFIGEIYGKAKAVKRQITTLERDKKETERRIQSAKDAYEKTEALLKKYEETHDFEHLSDFEKTEYRELVQKAEAERLQLEYLQQLSEQQSSKIEQLTEYTKETNSRVLTKEEILMLPSEARAFMLDESNLNRYSKEQQKVLKELTKELNLKDPSILQSIQDQAYLARLKEANASAYNMILSNPEAAAVQLQVQQEINSSQVNNYISRLIGEQLDRAVRRLARESNMSKEDIGNVLYSKLREYNPYILDYLYNTRTDEKGLGTIATYKEIMQKAKDWSEMVANIRNAIDKMELDDTTTKLFSKNIEHLIDEAGSTEEAMQILNDISESMDVSTEDRANFKKLLSMIDGIEKQKASTVKETKESKEARQESQETQVKQEEKKVQDAEKEVETKSSAKNSRTYWEAFKEIGINEGEFAGSIENNPANKTAGITSTLSHLQAEVVRRKTRNVFEDAANSDRQRLHDAVTSNTHATSANVNLLKYLYLALDAVKEGRMSADEAMALVEYHLNVEDSTHKEFIANLHSQRGSQLAKETRTHKYIDMGRNEASIQVEKEPVAVTNLQNGDRFFGPNNTIVTLREKLPNNEYLVDERGTTFVASTMKGGNWSEWLKTNPKVDRIARTNKSFSQSNIQEAYQETEKEKSNEKNAQEAIEVTDKEATNDNYTKEHKEEIITNGEEAPTESPNLDKQVANTKSEKPITVREVTTDVTNQGNTLQSSSSDMLGNTMYGYDNKALEEDGKEVVRAGSDPKDAMSRYFNWLHNEGIKLQEIIDNELHSISKVNKKIELLYVNPLQNATDDAALGNFTLLCVEYTDEVAKIHKEERGGVVTAGGKKYLIVGTLGFAKNNTAQGDAFRSITRQGHQQRDSYFRDNPTERFFVDKSMSTEIEQMTSGRIVREKIGDSETKVRPITEILNDSSRNPKGLKLVDLKWGIQYGRKFATVGVSERNTVYPPRDSISNSGAVFVLIEAANGNYIPAAIKPTLLGDIQEGTFKTILNNLFNELTSVNYNDRKKAISQLVQLLVLNKNGNNILIGKEGINTVSIVRESNILKTFNVADSNFDRMELIRAIEDLNPRINITLSTLSDPVLLQAFADAGALNTDIAKLGTSNAGFTVSAIDAEGKPIKTVTIENKEPNLEGNSDLAKANYKQQHSIYYKGTLYREKNNKWYTDNWKEVTDIDTIQQLKLSNYIRTNNLSPVLVNSSKQKGKVVEVYVINDSKVITKEDGVLIERNEEDSKKITTYLRNKQLQKDREQKAQEELKTKQPEASENTTPKVLTDEQLIAQGNGDFTSTAKPQSTDSEVRAQEVVDRIITDTHDIVLDEKRSIYTDSTGKEYARVTSVIQATEGAKRFYPNSPWILPSTKIGTGIDEFVRDFFAGKLGNLENLHKRYPNASLPQLQAFEKQLKELKADFDKKGLTVVPRDVTVTGEVEVTDANGKKYKLSVAGTLDLLAYDKDGNFYIFDMKTNRSIPNDNKASKWSKQLSLYKQFLEEKYGINVKGTEIIPIKVSYPSPYAVSYKAEGNQLSTTVDGLEESFRSSKPILYPNIPISTSPVKVEYNLLTNEERSMLSPIIDGTYNPTTGTINKESVNKSNEDINKTGNKSLAELQASANTNPTDINSILKNRTYSRRVREVLKKKGFKGKPSEVTEWLKEHNMPSTNIQDIDAWLDMLENCR